MDNCEGCLNYDPKINECHDRFPMLDGCPCRECLIKVMCKTACESFLNEIMDLQWKNING